MLLFSFTIFVSAFLLFLVQPLIARIILPWFGGTAAVWTTCLMFFQTSLLAGYLYAHASVKFLTTRRQATLHLILLAVSLLALPILPGRRWRPGTGDQPVLHIVIVLAITVGVPYLLLSTTGPILQAWFARQNPGVSPYRLYALSNAGSLLALISYPVLIEPALRLAAQAYVWSAAYGLFVILCSTLSLTVLRLSKGVADSELLVPVSAGPKWTYYLLWAALAFCPSALLSAFTSHLTQNIAPIPLLWVVPLAAYLLSFILTFESERWYRRRLFFPAFVAFEAILLAFLFPSARNASVLILLPVFVAGFFVCAMTCHGELFRSRPAPAHLTAFYLMIAVGGALGGLFVAVIAPLVFRSYLEAPIALLGCVILIATVLRGDRPSLPGPSARMVEWGLLAALAAGFVYLLGFDIPRWIGGFRFMDRNFYGVLRVADITDNEDQESMRELYHGSITHGAEFLSAESLRVPTTYYGPKSGVGVAISNTPAKSGRRFGFVGLGAGTLAAYGQAGDFIRFYEINPLVVRIARDQFQFLSTCPAALDIASGDARLSLEREQPQRYDVLAIDAFSGDSIPVHLLTVEAFAEYFRHLSAQGIVAVHVSNKYLDLPRVVGAASRRLGKQAIEISDSGEGSGLNKSDWILLAKASGTFDDPKWAVPGRSELLFVNGRLWTDDYSNLLAILRGPSERTFEVFQ